MKNHTTKLIQGVFTKEKASTLMLELISHKIRYHQLQKFSSEERFGKDTDHSEKRIIELTEEKQKLIDWINSLEDAETIEITGHIHFQVK